MKIEAFECFVVSHRLDPRTGPSIAYSTTHDYVVVKIVDEDGRVGWGETYSTPGVLGAVVGSLEAVLADESSLRDLKRTTRWIAGGLNGGGFATSAIGIALEDLRAKQLGVSVAEMLGGPTRDRVRMYAASGGYIEGRRPGETWFDELERVLGLGFTALKLRIGGYPIEEEASLLEKIREAAGDSFDLLADGNAAYTYKEALRMGRVMEALRFGWYEEPMQQRDGYLDYELLQRELEVPIAGGEALMTGTRARQLFEKRGVDIVQPDPVIAGGVGDALSIAELAGLYGIVATPHTSNSAIGIAAALQVIACLPPYTRAIEPLEPLLEYGVDDSPFRKTLLKRDFDTDSGWVSIPNGPGLGIEIDEEFLAANAIEHVFGPSR